MHLTISEASSFIDVSPSTLRRYERLGLIQAKRTVGGHRRYLIADLRARVARRHKVPKPAALACHIAPYPFAFGPPDNARRSMIRTNSAEIPASDNA